MRLVLPLMIALTICGPAVAAGAKADAEPKAGGQYVDLIPLALPVITNGMVRNYIYLRVRVNLGPGVDSVKAREKEPYLRNALIHAGYRTPFTASDSFIKLDEAKLKAAMANEARGILGAKAVTSVTVISQDPQRISNVGRPS